MAIGEGSHIWSNADESMALGYWAQVGENATNAVALGVESKTLSKDSVVVGSGANVDEDADGSIAIGKGAAVESSYFNSAKDGSTGAVALGSNAHAKNRNTTAIGSGAIAGGDKSTALGNNARTAKESVESVSFGYWAQANADNSVALGSRSVADEANTVSVGSDNMKRRVTNAADAIFEAGSSDLVTAGQLFKAGITPGYVADEVTGGISIGDPTNTRVEGDNAIAIGNGARATKDNAISIGAGSRAYATSGIALGISAQVYENATNSIALGDHSIADRKNTVSVGKVGAERQITNVAVGTAKTDAVNVKQLSDATVGAGMVTWDPALDENGDPIEGKYTDSIHGVQLAGDGAISAASDRFSVDRNGNIAAQTYGGQGEPHYYFNMNQDDGISFGHSDGASVTVGENGTTFTYGDQSTIINGNNITTFGANGVTDGQISTGHVYASQDMYIGGNADANKVATMGDLGTEIGEATEGVVRWDTDDAGKYVDGSLKGVHFRGKGQVAFGDGNKVFINGETGDVFAYQVGTNSVVTEKLSAGNGSVNVDENGKLSTTGEVLMQNGNGESLAMTDGGLSLMSTDNGTGMVTVANGEVNLMGGGNTTVTVDGNGTTFGTLTGDAKTTISGGSITGLTNQKWNGTTDDPSRAATEGQLAALSTTVSTNNEGVVRWDTDGDGKYQEGYLTAKHQLIAGGGNLKVDEEGVHLKTADEYFGDSTEPSSYYLDMTNENGISMGYTNGTSMKVTQNGGVAFSDASGNATWINGNNIDSGANGIFHTGKVIASGSMYVGNDSDEGNAVVTQKQLTSSVDEATEGVVKWDDADQDSIHGVGLENGKVTADSASIGNILMNRDQILIDGTTSLSKDGLVINDGNGNSVYLGGGQLMVSGNIQAGSGTIGNVKIANGLVDGVDVSELAGNVSALDQNAVKWDDENHNSINGVGLADGNVTADKVTTGELDVNGHADISGNLHVGGSLTVGGETVATGADVTDIKKQIGVNEDGSYKTIENGANDVITGINKNAADIGNVTALKGTNANGEKYTNLTDAVNGNYDRIEQNTTAIAQNSQAINSLGHRVSDLGDEIDSVGAISAALAGLHPLDYDGTGSKFQISAAMGTYDGTQAAAIGGFYHFNRDVMLSLGGATSFEGDKKTAANIGVTFRVGEGASGKTVSNDILTRLEAMDQKIAALEQENKELKNVLGAIDTSLSKEFPDVPANHWAYEAVTKLAGNDVVAGYPDGEFHGDRTMTRYEMAEIIYKAMNRGAKVDQKLVEEFKPEMEQVAANETAQAQSTPAQEAPAQDAQ